MPSAAQNRSPVRRPAFVCGAVLLLATLVMAQHALDANLRVGSGGRNAPRPRQATMARDPYSVNRWGTITYNRSQAFNDDAYSRPMMRHQQSIGSIEPTRMASRSGSTLARSRYNPGQASAARSTAQRSKFQPSTRVQSVHHAAGSATIQRSSYRPSGRVKTARASSRVSAMQTPTVSIARQPYSATGLASQPVRSR